MAKRQRRHSQNSQLMRRIMLILREYDVDEIQLLCDKYMSRTERRRTRRVSKRMQRIEEATEKAEAEEAETAAVGTSKIAKISRRRKTKAIAKKAVAKRNTRTIRKKK